MLRETTSGRRRLPLRALAVVIGLALPAAIALVWPMLEGKAVRLLDGSSIPLKDLAQLGTGETAELRGVVTFSDPVTREFYIQDQTGGARLTAPKEANLPQAGDEVEARAVVHLTGDLRGAVKRVDLEAREVSIGAHAALPSAEPLSLPDIFAAAGLRDAHRIETSGVVRLAEKNGDRLELEMAHGGQRIQLTVLDAAALDARSLIDARIAARGVLRLDFDSMEETSARETDVPPHLWVSSARELSVTSKPPEQSPLVPSARALITDPQWLKQGRRVRLQGIVWQRESEEVVLIDSGGLILPVETPLAGTFNPGDTVESAGWPQLRRFTTTLQ